MRNREWSIPRLGSGFTSTHMKVFPPEKEIAIIDAAKLWGKQGGSSAIPKRDNHVPNEQNRASRSIADGAAIPFDVASTVSYSMIGVSGVLAGSVEHLSGPPLAVTSVDLNGDQNDDDARDATILMGNIETDRIPCPRLCGATFGPGFGGLVVFNNGAVRKMWRWWEKTNPTRVSAVPGLICEPSVTGTGQKLGEKEALTVVSVPPRECPRTLQDLMDMSSSAKEAQWGNQDEPDTSLMELCAGSTNFFESASDGSSESSDDDSNEDLTGTGKDVYDSYFNESRQPHVEACSAPSQDASELNLDVLASFVSVSHKFDVLALNNQSIYLAEKLKLGIFLSCEDESPYTSDDIKLHIVDDVEEANERFDSLNGFTPQSPLRRMKGKN
jgi:hypothetical protein